LSQQEFGQVGAVLAGDAGDEGAVIRGYQRSLNKPPASPREHTVEDMVKCAHCGVNLPRSEAIYSAGDFFCTPEHKQLGKK
jgi:uncharacterized protein